MDLILQEKVKSITNKFPNQLLFIEILKENNKTELLPNEFMTMLNKIISNACEFSDKEKSFHELDIIYELSWEHINMGMFKDVPSIWRTIFAISCLLLVNLYLENLSDKKIEIELLKKCLYLCDMSIIMGGEIKRDWNIASSIASEIHSIIVQVNGVGIINEKNLWTTENFNPNEFISKELQENVHALPRIFCPSITEFLEIVNRGSPVILTNIIDHWPALSTNKWSVGHIKNVCGYRTVPIEIGSTYAENDWSQRLMTVNEFVDKYFYETGTEEKAYLAQHYLFSQITELSDDMSVPDYCFLSNNDGDMEIDINGWFGPSGTVSPLHQDPKPNLLCQVFGEKYVKLYPENQTPLLYPHSLSMLKNTSKIDVFKPDLDSFPLFAGARGFDGILGKGDVLFIPPRCWHYVRSIAPSFSINFWWNEK